MSVNAFTVEKMIVRLTGRSSRATAAIGRGWGSQHTSSQKPQDFDRVSSPRTGG